MSRENVDVIRRVLAAGACDDVEAILALRHPEWEGLIPDESPAVAGVAPEKR